MAIGIHPLACLGAALRELPTDLSCFDRVIACPGASRTAARTPWSRSHPAGVRSAARSRSDASISAQGGPRQCSVDGRMTWRCPGRQASTSQHKPASAFAMAAALQVRRSHPLHEGLHVFARHRVGCRHGKQAARQRQALGLGRRGQQPVVAYPLEARRQHMAQQSGDELLAIEHDAVLAPGRSAEGQVLPIDKKKPYQRLT